MMRTLRALALVLLVSAPVMAGAEAVPTEQDPVAAARAMELARKLRCLVCQNETIAESRADLANDLRRQIRDQIAAGRSDGEIVEFMVSRYGEFVLYDPAFTTKTALLWMGPGLLVIAGTLMLMHHLRRSRLSPPPLTPAERALGARLLAGDSGEHQ